MIGNVSFICFLMVTVWCLFGNVCHAGEKFFTENEVFGFFFLFLSCFVRICISRTKDYSVAAIMEYVCFFLVICKGKTDSRPTQ